MLFLTLQIEKPKATAVSAVSNTDRGGLRLLINLIIQVFSESAH